MADHQNQNDSTDPLNQKDLHIEDLDPDEPIPDDLDPEGLIPEELDPEGLSIEDVGIPLGDFEDEPIPLNDEAILEEVETDTAEYGTEGASDPSGNPDEIYAEILEDPEDAPLPLVLEDPIPENEELVFSDELDPDALPISDLVETDEPEPPSPRTPESEAPQLGTLEIICQQLENLEKEFQSKLKYDSHKEKIIDNLHRELQGYKENLVRKLLMNTFKDIIKVIDDIQKMIQYFDANQTLDENPGKILSFLKAVPSDLEDILVYQGVTPFCSLENAFDPSRQRVMKKIATSEYEKDKTVAEHLRPGYAHEDHIIRPELVDVYVFEDDSDPTEIRSSDE
jgi:molecular chaperone GrpE (heat shock protein)